MNIHEIIEKRDQLAWEALQVWVESAKANKKVSDFQESNLSQYFKSMASLLQEFIPAIADRKDRDDILPEGMYILFDSIKKKPACYAWKCPPKSDKPLQLEIRIKEINFVASVGIDFFYYDSNMKFDGSTFMEIGVFPLKFLENESEINRMKSIVEEYKNKKS